MRTEVCEACRRQPAGFAVCKVVGSNTYRERHLCISCARDSERIQCGDSGLSLTDLLNTFIVQSNVAEEASTRTKVCPGCGNTFDETQNTGMLGCSMCYTVFRDYVDSAIGKLHGYSPGIAKPG